MIHRVCLLAALVAAASVAQENEVAGCGSEADASRPDSTPGAVTYWNEVADHSIAVLGGKRPEQGLVEAAIVHTAVYDAVNAICGYPFTPYAVTPKSHRRASQEAAVAAAAHDVLVALYPDQKGDLDQTYTAFLDGIPHDPWAKLSGVATGQQAAAGILALRANDGRNAGTPWDPPPLGPGIWQPTPPGFLPPSAPWVRQVTPWTMTGPSQFRVPPPPGLDSDVWVRDYNETKDYGGAISSARNAEQTDLGQFIGGAGVHPMVQWHNAWRNIAVNQHLSTLQAARLFAILSTASSDAMIGCWDSKYTYAFWRPVTAIRAGGGNPRLQADPNWTGLVITPNHPEYPAAHGCFSGAVVAALQAYFETDQLSFAMSSPAPGLTQAVRQYDRLSQALEDILNSRIYGGMHYRNSLQQGAALGQQVARQVVERFFLPRCKCNQDPGDR